MDKTFIEVCSGAGGFSLGFIEVGFKPLLLNDFDKICCKTLKENHNGVKISCSKMEDLDLSEWYGKVDVLVGGLPCQSFSQIGKRKGLEDPRGGLFFHFIKMIENISPKIFIVENVVGLLTHNNGATFKIILDKLNEINLYNISYKVLNANDYNVPQNRKRLFIVGSLKSLRKFKFPKEQEYKPVLRDILRSCEESDGIEYPDKKKKLFDLIPEDGCWINLPENLQKEYLGKSFYSGGGKRGILKRLSMDKPCLTLLTTPTQKQTERCHPLHTRPLQILEYSRIQTFPDTYKFCGSIRQIYKQIGNAVPVNLSKMIAKEIKNILD